MFDESLKHALLQRIPHGVYVCGVTSGLTEQRDAFTLTWLTQASFAPPVIAIAVRRQSHANALIRASKVFSINFLGRSQHDVAEHFKESAAGQSRLDGYDHHPGVTGAPILAECAGAIECTVVEIIEHGDHDLIVAEVFATEEGSLNEPQLLLSDTEWEYGG